MKSESHLIVEVWDLVRDHLPASRRLEIAISMLRAFEEYGFSHKDMQDVQDDDVHLTRAYHDLFEDEEDHHHHHDDHDHHDGD